MTKNNQQIKITEEGRIRSVEKELTQEVATIKETSEINKNSSKKENEQAPTFEFTFAAKLVQEKQYAFENDTVYRWSENHWKAMPDNFLAKKARNFLDTEVRRSLVNSCTEIAKLALPELPKISSDRIIIPCKKWYIEIVDGEKKWRKPSPSYGFTHFINTNCTDKPGKLFTQYLDTSVPDEQLQLLLQEYAGYTLLNDNRYEAAMLLSGVGANGKSVFIEVLRALHVFAKSMRLDQMKGFELAGIVGASLLTSDETPKKKVCVDTLKAIVSGNSIQLRALYGKPFDYVNRAKIIVSANEIPSFDEQAANGFWRRFIFVPFEHVVPRSQRNPLLAKQIINDELGSVLQWALDGLMRLMANNGQFTKPTCTETLKTEVRMSGNSVLQWLNDHEAVETTAHDTLKTDVYNEYYEWAEENALEPASSVAFWKQMKYQLSFKWGDKQKRTVDRKVKRFVNFKVAQIDLSIESNLFPSTEASNEEVVVNDIAANECPF